MSTEAIAKALLPVNCFYHYEIRNGRCFGTECMMNQDEGLREKIKKNGCGCFNMPKVIEMAEKEAHKISDSGHI